MVAALSDDILKIEGEYAIMMKLESHVCRQEERESYTAYIIETKDKYGRRWEVGTRYSEVLALLWRLSKYDHVVKGVEGRLPPMPGKRYLWSKTDPKLVAERTEALNVILGLMVPAYCGIQEVKTRHPIAIAINYINTDALITFSTGTKLPPNPHR